MKPLFFIPASLLLAFSLHSNSIEAQMVTTDPALLQVEQANWTQNASTQLKQLSQQVSQVEQLKQQTSTFTEILDNIKKVSSIILTSSKVKNILVNQYALITTLTTQMSNAGKNKTSVTLYNSYISQLQNIVNQNQENMDELLRVTTSGTYKLSDFERLQMIDKINDKTNELKSEAISDQNAYTNMSNLHNLK